jgi:hypothetical protein
MRKLLVFSALVISAITTAWAQGQAPKTQFFIDWDNAAKKCVVVTAKPADKDIVGGGPFNTRDEAVAAIKNVKGC